MKAPQWSELPQQLQQAYLLGGRLKKEDWYINEASAARRLWPRSNFDALLKKAQNREPHYYERTDTWLYKALDAYPVKGRSVAIMGSTEPWYETVTLAFGGKPTTIEYNLPGYGHPDIEELSVQSYWENPRQFDVALSISSFEHDGLGRYGDPLDPDGDLRAMLEMTQIVKKGGILILAVPMGVDKIVWNAHRVYGPVRYPMLIEGWKMEASFGMDASSLDCNKEGYQPVAVLRNGGDGGASTHDLLLARQAL